MFDLVVSSANQPQDGVEHEEAENADEKDVHEQANEVKAGAQGAVVCIGVRLIFDEACVGPGVALAAGSDEVCRIDGREGIGRRPDVVGAVAIPAARRFHVAAESAELRVEGVVVGGEHLLVA